MSVDDPFGSLKKTGETPEDAKPAPVEDTVPTKTEPKDAVEFDISSFIAEMTLDAEDFEQPAEVIFKKYIKPAHGTWIPLEITDAKVELREGQRAVVAYSKDGQQIMSPKGIDILVSDHGATEEIIDDASFFQFKLEAEHVAECFGERQSPYLMFAPVFDMRIPLKNPKKGKLGWDKKAGRHLVAATRILKPGDKILDNEEALNELAKKMIGKKVLAKVRRKESTREESKPRVHENGSFVKARVDQTEGAFILLTKKNGTVIYKASGEVYEGDTDGLIPFGDDLLIPDTSDDSAIVKDMVKSTMSFDNLEDDVASVPSLDVEIHRVDGSDVQGVITWETVGFIATKPVKSGTAIQAEITEGGEKKIITATWLGDMWEETPDEQQLQVTDAGEVRYVPVDKGDGTPADLSGLDMFKGDAPKG